MCMICYTVSDFHIKRFIKQRRKAMSVKEYYAENKQFGNRYDTDAQLIDVTQPRQYAGVMDRQARFIEQNQLFNTEYWLLFVEQFRTAPDDADLGWRGEYFGKMMRGACMTYQYTKNEKLYDVLSLVIAQMLEAQDRDGRFSTYSVACELKGWDMWCRKYVLLGFLHFHEICTDPSLRSRIEAAMERHLDYIIAHVGTGDKKALAETSHRWGAINSASILEPVMKMYCLTGREAYLDFARYIVDFLTNSSSNIITLALENKRMPYEYPITKAYEMMSCFEGLLEYYRATGEEKWKNAVILFVDSVIRSEITLIGCAGCRSEQFNHSVAMQTDTEYKGIMQETCVTVTWMKLCNQLLMLTGQAKYADQIERSFYNALYGAINHRGIVTGYGGFLFDSYSPLTLGQRGRSVGGYKSIGDGKFYGCCVAIGAAGTALPLLTAATDTKKGVAVNYYEAGTVCVGGFTLRLETEYPADGSISITVEQAPTGEKELSVRIPGFAAANSRIDLNGSRYPVDAGRTESFYVSISRQWSAGDTVRLTLDMAPRLLRPLGVEGKPETKDYLAVMFGPLVLARDAQLTQVADTVRLSDALTVEPKDKDGFACVLRARVLLGDREMDMIDYGSAGKTWDRELPMEAWIKCE